jgi:hypothetical protein
MQVLKSIDNDAIWGTSPMTKTAAKGDLSAIERMVAEQSLILTLHPDDYNVASANAAAEALLSGRPISEGVNFPDLFDESRCC